MLGTKGEAEVIFYACEMEMKDKRGGEWAVAVTQTEAY